MGPPGSPSQSPVLPRRNASAGRDPSATRYTRLGRYQITGRLGEGGMGVVYEAEDTLLKRQVAIKLLPKDVSANPEALKRFLREAQAAARLNHPHVVAVYDIGESDGTHFIVMELVRGGNAQEVLRSRGPFHWAEATSILIDVCRGVAAAHKAGLIHRDIKPANILRSAEGIVKLGDFGLAKAVGRKGTIVTALGAMVGTPHFMSPEQSQNPAVDERSDIYSLGATYFALLTGRPPFQASDSMQVLFAHSRLPIPDPREIVKDVPEACTVIIRKAMAKNRTQRQSSVGELLVGLERILALSSARTPGTPALAPAPTFAWRTPNPVQNTNPPTLAEVYPGERTESVIARKRASWKLISACLMGLLVLGLLAGFFLRSDPAPAPHVVVEEDWPSLSVAADQALRRRSVTAMKDAVARIQVLPKRLAVELEDVHKEMRATLARLEKAVAFRESITEKGRLLGSDGVVTSVVVSPDDRWLAVGQASGSAGAYVWDSHTGEKRFTLWPRLGAVQVKVHGLAYSHDSAILAAGCADMMGVKLWHWADGKEASLAVDKRVNRVSSVAFGPLARKLIAGFEPFGAGLGQPYAKIWNIDTGKEPFQFKAEHSAKILSVAFCGGGEQVATGSHDRRVVLWNAETGRIWRELRTGIAVRAIACAPQGGTLAVAGRDNDGDVVQIWNYPAENMVIVKRSPHGSCQCIAFSRDGSLLASGSGAKILLWNVSTNELVATLEGHGHDVTSLAIAAEGGILASGSRDQTARLWDVTRFLPVP